MTTSTNNLLKFITNSKGISHSFILSGEEGAATAKQLACTLLKTTDITAHPNILWLDADQKIGVDNIRNIGNFVFKTTYHADAPKLIVITSMDSLNIFSMNALLKVIEEPTKNTHFILLSNNIGFLPDTIRSRSIVINLPPSKITKESFPDISNSEFDEYLSMSSSTETIASLIKKDALKLYSQLLEFIGSPQDQASTGLYRFIEQNFSTLEQLEIFQTLIAKAIRSTKNIGKLIELEKELTYLLSNVKTLGLDIKTVVLIVVYKLSRLRPIS